MKGRTRAAALAAGIAFVALTGVTPSHLAAQDPASSVARPMADAPYWNASLPTEQRVADLLARMTLDEKIAQIITLWDNKVEIQDDDFSFDPAKASKTHPAGIGMIARPSDLHGPGSPRVEPPRSIEQSVAYVNAVQNWARENTRLGIPVLFHEESLHGLAARDATSFPQAIALASTWDPDLIREVNALIASEVRRARRPPGAVAGRRRCARPALGPDRGDVRRGSVPGRRNGRRRGRGAAGQGHKPQDRAEPRPRHAQAHDGSRPARKRHQCRPGADRRADAARVLLPAVRTGREAHRDRRGHGQLQRDRRHPEPLERLAAARRAARRMGIPGRSGLRLLRHRRAGDAAQDRRRPQGGRGNGARRRRRYRPADRQRLHHVGRCREIGPGADGCHRPGRGSNADDEVQCRAVREPLGRPCRGEKVGRSASPRAGAQGRRGIAHPAQE